MDGAGGAGGRRLVHAVTALAIVAAGLFGVGILLGLTVVGRHGGGPIQGWDDQVQTWSVQHRAGLTGVSKVVAFLGDAPKLAVIAVVLSVVWSVASRSIRGVTPLVAYLGAELEVFLIREIVHRHRPPTANYPAPGAVRGIHETSFSFPSGHAVAVTAVLFAIAGTVAFTHKQWWPWIPAGIASLFVSETRLVLGVHWFSDVTFGLVLGVIWGVTVAWVAQRLDWSDLLLRRPHGGAGRRTTTVSSGATGPAISPPTK